MFIFSFNFNSFHLCQFFGAHTWFRIKSHFFKSGSIQVEAGSSDFTVKISRDCIVLRFVLLFHLFLI